MKSTEALKAENKQLQEALEQRTLELTAKNRELEIQNSLERIRGIAMGMSKPDDLLEIAENIFAELKKHGFDSLRNTMINIYQDQLDSLLNYDFSPNSGKTLTTIQYKSHPLTENLIKETRSSKDVFSEFQVKGKKLQEWRDYRKGMGENDDPALDNTSILSYYFFSFAAGSIGISTYEPISSDKLEILKSFKNTFELTYKRYLDIQNALAQARESQIEAALERLRARSLSMQKSEELADASILLEEEIRKLGIENWGCAFHIYDEETTSGKPWDLEWFTSMAGILPFYKTPRENIFLRYYEESKKGNPLYIQEFGPDVIKEHYEYLKTLPVLGEALTDLHNSGVPLPEKQIDHVAFFKHGHLLFITYKPVPEAHDIFIRFAKVFNQAYTRFLDLEKAEAQARESQIEVALERVRAKTMGMHSSDELLEIVDLLYAELSHLDVALARVVLLTINSETKAMHWWMASPEKEIKTHGFLVPPNNLPMTLSMIEAWENKKSAWSYHLNGKDKKDYDNFLFAKSELAQLPEEVKMAMSSARQMHVSGYCNNFGLLTTSTLKPLSSTNSSLLERFGLVFQQTYTRFLDLQKAEAQAREAEIQLALERVRAKTMAMQSSDELTIAATEMFSQIKGLGLNPWSCGFNIFNDDKTVISQWVSTGDGRPIEPFDTPTTKGIFKRIVEDSEKEETLRIEKIGGKKLKDTYNYMASLPTLDKIFEELDSAGIALPKKQVDYAAYFKQGYLMFITYDEVPEFHSIFKRFAKVFEQTYTRFLDLQKAEAQAREAEIQLALERVRARTMAMQKSEELADVAFILFEQLRSLGGTLWGTGFGLCEENSEKDEFWFANENGVLPPVAIPNTTDAAHKQMRQGWQEKFELLSIEKSGKALSDHYDYMLSLSEVRPFFQKIIDEGLSFPENQEWNAAYFSKGYLLIITLEPYPDKKILQRFANVFEQTYTRFLDLQKAERQAREAQIEAALEKIRSRTMGMQHSNELPDAAHVLFNEVRKLGIPAWSCGYNILSDDKKSSLCWMSSENEVQPSFRLPLTEHISLQPWYEAIIKGEDLFVYEQGGEDLVEHYRYLGELPDLKSVFAQFDAAGISLPTFQVNHLAKFDQGFLLFITYERVPGAHDIFQRFTKVFNQTYTRFLDLKKAEARAKESQIETALERVRSRTMGMQQSEELGDVATILFNEMNGLVSNLWTCGFVLCEENRKEDEWWLSMDTGFTRGFFLPNVGDFAHASLYEGWQKGEALRSVVLEGDALSEHYNWLVSLPIAKKVFDEMDEKGIERPTWQKLHAAYFKTGYLVIITAVPCAEEEIFKRFAQVFDLTYTRFLDLQQKEEQGKKLVEEKLRLERTLKDLQATQAQLIQSEKMASLGELTAGIAHEIQNPLNFVNNFSEVSSEMFDELIEEIEKGDMEEVKALSADIKENLIKIKHHGKRADSIVKGMLEHSRSSSGEKTLTDINALADEFLRLSYHGIRAKDKSFNSDFKLELDPQLPKVNIIGKDIGRVILNLVNNAFYACAERSRGADNDFRPEVLVSTKRSLNGVELSVKDNGNGIPDSVKDKIFQPFFTTKPTGSGTGLGLSLSYDIVKAHAGEIRVLSTVGEGTEMAIFLPIEE
ncbi:sensor histidine kinase [Algoriphagus winogradskyi]|uniref:histidine kinase n=1 Tax=Algoriphagus winogradskyi TaxID=237017 RepID=A0ABY1NKG0_9BACT|nr:ATP-binding protein [Algoriphagus winogradskyi]SMP11401.1 His Kinase A (phospho-acceptor) domain-containing protein [Algoriphagus winogradskyi]